MVLGSGRLFAVWRNGVIDEEMLKSNRYGEKRLVARIV